MPFEKGKSGNKNGRPKGVGNKSTEKARMAIALFVDDNSERLQGWLDEIAKESPLQAFNCVKDLLEYHLPKQARIESRVENRYVDEEGKDLHKSDKELLKKMGIDL